MGRDRVRHRQQQRHRLGSGHTIDDNLITGRIGSIDFPGLPPLHLPSRKEVKKKLMSESDFLTRSIWFESQVERAFKRCDVDNTGSIDKTELWAGILLLYHILNKIPFGGHVAPPSQKYVFKIFHIFDVDRSGLLEQEEFLAVSRHICVNVGFDILRRGLVSLFLVPLIVQLIMFYFSYFESMKFVTDLHPAFVISGLTALLYLLIPSVWTQY
mmetsp:Transcript_3718/g.4644  ORF Transcript_3718/g.4644 Transcript_3718/m.4644 type:complete len:213 (-) Transcript_3718:918-1556(-)